MIAVIFQVTPKDGKSDIYFDIAGELRSELEKIDGFLSIERFESRTIPGKYLSLSFWRDEEAVRTWRNQENHALAQARGKREIFEDYRISVAEVVRDYTMADSL
ncbi:MAG: antibiotic biosynthesis monooxygenase [Rhodospirillales bacterium]|nr:antibiotic biosynthesis monooxygenase [Rhodospirillales bacterium]